MTEKESKCKSKPKSKRCAADDCKKKLSLVDLSIVCKCGNNYCSIHRYKDTHNCTYDYQTIDKESKAKKIEYMKCVADKVLQV